jgi:hypothetical protein
MPSDLTGFSLYTSARKPPLNIESGSFWALVEGAVALTLGFGDFGVFAFLRLDPFRLFRQEVTDLSVVLLAISLEGSMLSVVNVMLFVGQQKPSLRLLLVICSESPTPL